MSPPQHPGELLRKVLGAMSMTQSHLATRSGLSPKHVNQVCQGLAGISSRSAILLQEVTGVDAELWLTMQMRHDLATARTARRDEQIADESRQAAARELARAAVREQR